MATIGATKISTPRSIQAEQSTPAQPKKHPSDETTQGKPEHSFASQGSKPRNKEANQGKPIQPPLLEWHHLQQPRQSELQQGALPAEPNATE